MTTRFVATAGNDTTGAGTQLNPYKTLAKAATVTVAGDTILGNGGDIFRETVVKAINNLTLGSYGTGQMTISGADVITGWAAATAPRYSVAMATQPYIVYVNGLLAVNGSSSTTLNNGEWFWLSNVLYYRSDAGNPDSVGLVIEAGQRLYCINPGADRSGWTVNNIKMTGANSRLLYNGGGTGVATGWTITNNTFTLGGAFNNGSGLNLLGCSNTLVQGNVFDYVQADNIFVQDGSNNVTIADNSFAHIGGGAAAGADCVQYGGTTPCTGGLITRNFMDRRGTDSPKSGIQLQFFAGTVSYNTIIGGVDGIEIDCSNVTVAYNIIMNMGTGIQSSASSGPYSNVTIHHNVIANVNHGIQWFTGTTRTNWNLYNNSLYNCAIHGIILAGTVSGACKNNIVRAPTARSGAFQMDQAIVGGGGWDQDYNCFGPEAPGFMFWTDAVARSTMAAWRTASGKDAHSITADPKFVNP